MDVEDLMDIYDGDTMLGSALRQAKSISLIFVNGRTNFKERNKSKWFYYVMFLKNIVSSYSRSSYIVTLNCTMTVPPSNIFLLLFLYPPTFPILVPIFIDL
jgi:hypothetical protein